MYDRILLPTDASDAMSTTLDHALSIAGDNDATLHALYVVDKRRYLGSDADEQETLIEDLRTQGRGSLDDIAGRAAEAGVECVTEIRNGIPHRDILDYAEEIAADMIVMGAHERTGREAVVSLGSVTERVVKESPVPVLTVRLG